MAGSNAAAAPRPAHRPAPGGVIAVGLIALAVVVVPLIALAFRVSWNRFGEVLTDPETLEMMRLSLVAGVLTAVISTMLGVPLAGWIAASRRGAAIVRLLVLLPLAMPPVVAGMALNAALGRRGVAAPLLDALGLQFSFTFAGVVAAHVFICLPFVVISADSALRSIDREVVASAAGLGLGPRRIWWRIVLPAIGPATATGAGLALSRSLGEFGATLTFAGSLPGETRTLPVGIYVERQSDLDRAYVLAAALLLMALIVLLIANLPVLLAKVHKATPASIDEGDIERLAALVRPPEGTEAPAIAVRYHSESDSGGRSAITLPAGETSVLVGPNGSGKSTLAGLIAGRLAGADVHAGDRELTDGRGRPVPAHRRGIVMLTQNPGLPRTTTAAGAITMVTRDKERTGELLSAAGLSEVAAMPVPQLSGGQAAQVALVRALAARPATLVLDEPLAAVDRVSEQRWHRLLEATARDRTTIIVSHQLGEIARLANRVVTVSGGWPVDDQDAGEFFAAPPTDFAVRLCGTNRIAGTYREDAGGAGRLETEGLTLPARPGGEHAPVAGGPAVAFVPATAVTLDEEGPWRATIVDLSSQAGGMCPVSVDLGGTRLTLGVPARLVASEGLTFGTEVRLAIDASQATVRAA